ncbi:unnamed protein product [Prunus armeniaca]
MRILILNCQGIEGNLTVSSLMEKVKLHTPDMVMLLETKTRSSRYVFLKKVLGMPFMHAMEDVEKGCVGDFLLYMLVQMTESGGTNGRLYELEFLHREPRSKEETLGLKGVLLDIHLLGVIDDKRKEYKNGWTGGLPMIIGYDFSPPQKISIGWLKGLIVLCFVSIHMRPRGGRKGILHMIHDGGGMRMRGLLDWKRREWQITVFRALVSHGRTLHLHLFYLRHWDYLGMPNYHLT